MSKKKISAPTIRSSAAEYLTFIAASGEGGVEAVYADSRSHAPAWECIRTLNNG